MSKTDFYRYLSLVALFGVACTSEEAAHFAAAVTRVDVPAMDLNFAFHEPLIVRLSGDEALLSGQASTMEAKTLPYAAAAPARSKQELPLWAIPAEVAEKVRAERSCAPLNTKTVFLPVDTTAPYRCDLVLDPSGRVVLWMVGLGRPFEDLTFMQSSFIVLEEQQYRVFSYVFPFPEADATAEWLEDTFEDRHPKMSTLIWPNKSFLLLMDEVRETLSKQIEPPSEEVLAAMDALRTLAFSVGPSQSALEGQ